MLKPYPLRCNIPVIRRTCFSFNGCGKTRSFRSTNSLARAYSSSVETASTASVTTASSTPCWRSSDLKALRARPRPAWRELTQALANAESSIKPTCAKRSTTSLATSTLTPRLVRSRVNAFRVLGAEVSRRSAISRASSTSSLESTSRRCEFELAGLRNCYFGLFWRLDCLRHSPRHTKFYFDLRLNRQRDVRIITQERPSVFFSLA